MLSVSVVIITRNEAHNIIDCIIAAKKISSDIIVVDTGSTDNTVLLAKSTHATVQTISWEGYGQARNAGALLARNNWIFSLDADERVSDNFAAVINTIVPENDECVYGFKRANYFSNRKMNYGSFAHDWVFRLYNKLHTQWNSVPVHEKLSGKNIKKFVPKAFLIHFTAATETDYRKKIMRYAGLCALKYQQEGKKFIPARLVISPAFSFIKDYIFQLGFLDNRAGFVIAKLHAMYTWEKYQQLKQLQLQEKKKIRAVNFLQHSLRRIHSFFS